MTARMGAGALSESSDRQDIRAIVDQTADHWPSHSDRLRTPARRRAIGILIALALEVALLVALLTMGPKIKEVSAPRGSVITLSPNTPAAEEQSEDRQSPDEPLPAQQQPRTAEVRPIEQRRVPDQPAPANQPQPEPRPSPLIELSREQMASADLRSAPVRPSNRAPAGPPRMGPPAPSGSGDTPRVGTAPNGEPLYAASWYREPYDQELSGYLSTARGPGWGLIACRTVADYRVEDCVGVGEYPTGSNIMRAVLAAAWQFRVRPPRIGGSPQVGEWVRIRIDYVDRR
jgi:periplasmic protein TonB